ncbi:hypothetical protein MNBD_BACTEROID03-280 [hydrothermal vent metagenome]|uniref:Uncharacterized protein n=1 Tax=hydrothermal vent metagenome TaxID=652676 RepID=A0A3B0SXX5_9ZZZZ
MKKRIILMAFTCLFLLSMNKDEMNEKPPIDYPLYPFAIMPPPFLFY